MSEVLGPMPIGSHLVLRKVEGGWQVVSHYPLGYSIPKSAMPYDTRRKRSLAAALEFIGQFHTDPYFSAGHPPAPDADGKPRTPIRNGTHLVMEMQSNGWNVAMSYSEGGASFRMSTYRSMAEVFEGIRLLYLVD